MSSSDLRSWVRALDRSLTPMEEQKLNTMTLTTDFKTLLRRLHELPTARAGAPRPLLARRVISLLDMMANDGELKNKLDTYCAELSPANACSDYVLTTFDSLQRLARHHALSKDRSTQGMSDFANYLIRCHRLAKVDKLAHEAIAALHRNANESGRRIDDVEELLQIRLALKESLDLPLDFDRNDTRFTALARVDQRTVREIGEKVRQETKTTDQQISLLTSDPEWRRVVEEMDDKTGSHAKARRQEASATLMDNYSDLEDPGFKSGIEAIQERYYQDATRPYLR